MSKDIYIDDLEIKKQDEFIAKVKIISDDHCAKLGAKPLAHVRTYGCQQNMNDGEKLKGYLCEMGYELTGSPEGTEVVLYNTCAIRENAEVRVFGNVGALKNEKRKNENLIIGICGCMPTQPHIADKIRKRYRYVDLVFDTHALYKLPELLYQKLKGQENVYSTSPQDGKIAEIPIIHRDSEFKANLPIMYGCNNFCTYCIVPYVRGRERSRQFEDIVSEAKSLVQAGYKEITLLGQNVNSYGNDNDDDRKFPQLLRELNDIDGEFLIKFMTSHPKDCNEELIDTIRDCKKISRNLHLPVQSGSDKILKAMNRKYTSEDYLKLVEYAKKEIPDIVLTSDIIVGFPNETKQDFDKTIDLIKKVRFHSLFTFIYSPRAGTVAAEMIDNTSDSDKAEWFKILLETQKKIGLEVYDAHIGEDMRVLVDGKAKQEGHLSTRTDTGIIVDLCGGADKIGEFVNVKIIGSKRNVLIGEEKFPANN